MISYHVISHHIISCHIIYIIYLSSFGGSKQHPKQVAELSNNKKGKLRHVYSVVFFSGSEGDGLGKGMHIMATFRENPGLKVKLLVGCL